MYLTPPVHLALAYFAPFGLNGLMPLMFPLMSLLTALAYVVKVEYRKETTVLRIQRGLRSYLAQGPVISR